VTAAWILGLLACFAVMVLAAACMFTVRSGRAFTAWSVVFVAAILSIIALAKLTGQA